MRIMVVAVSVAALVLAATGCGGSSSSSEGDAAATVESADTTAADTTGGTDTTGAETTGTGDVSLEGCTKLAELSVKFSQALGAATTGSGAPDLDATAKAYEDFADEVPEEIRDAFRTIAAAFGTYADVLGDVDLSSGKTPDPETLQKLAEAAQIPRQHRAHGRERRDRGLGEGELHRVAPTVRALHAVASTSDAEPDEDQPLVRSLQRVRSCVRSRSRHLARSCSRRLPLHVRGRR